jgi:hypothetical protein
MSYSDLEILMKKVQSFITTANGDSPSEITTNKLTVSNELDSFTQKTDLTNISYNSFPAVGYRLDYRLFHSE